MNTYYIVEHASRGCYVGETRNDRPRCSYSILRSDNSVKRFYTEAAAQVVRDRIPGAYILIVRREGKKFSVERI